MADRSAAFKALAARLINNAAVPAAGYGWSEVIGAAAIRCCGRGAGGYFEANP
jgi:hypothetical protein